MNTLKLRFKQFLYNSDLLRRRYIVYKKAGVDQYYVETRRLFSRPYYLHPTNLEYKMRKMKDIQMYYYFTSIINAQKQITLHIKANKKHCLRFIQVYEE